MSETQIPMKCVESYFVLLFTKFGMDVAEAKTNARAAVEDILAINGIKPA
jgi:hypothetical protein